MSKSHKPLIGFREYIKKRRVTDSRQGDFTASAKVDPKARMLEMHNEKPKDDDSRLVTIADLKTLLTQRGVL